MRPRASQGARFADRAPDPPVLTFRVICSPRLGRPWRILARRLSLDGAAALAATLRAQAARRYSHRPAERIPVYAHRPDPEPPRQVRGQYLLAL